ncbi:MAG: outer membrane protein assembly factor [bacterium]|nr:outer membrane protein assembly factor [bacterium]
MLTKFPVTRLLLLFLLVIFTAGIAVGQKIPREFISADGLLLHKVELEGCPLPASEVWPKVATAQAPWYHKFVFWKKKPQFDGVSFARDVIRLDHFLRREGWRDCKVSGEVQVDEKEQVTAIYHVTVKDPTRVLAFGFNAFEMAPRDTVRFRRYIALENGGRFREIDLVNAVDSLRLLYSKHGYARTKITPTVQWSNDSLYVEINFKIESGGINTFDTASVYGVQRLKPKDVTADILARPGKSYNYSLIERSRRILYSRNLFRSVDIVTDTSVKGNRLPLRVRVVEADRWQTRFGPAWDTDELLQMTGEITDRFLLPGGRTVKLSAGVAFQGKSTNDSVDYRSIRKETVDLKIVQPHPFGPGSELTVSPFALHSNEDGIDKIGSTQAVSFPSGPWWTIQFAQRLQRIWIINQKSAENSSLELSNFQNLDLYILTGTFDFRTEQFEATQGGIFQPEIAVSGIFLPSSSRFFRLRGFGNYNVTYDKKLTYATRVETGALILFPNSPAPPPDEKFHLGGLGLIRGWSRRELSPRDASNTPIGGESYCAGSLEVRYKLWGPLWSAFFFDAGTVWEKYQSYGKWPLQTTAGAGVRLRTPIGPVRIDIGWQLKRNQFYDKPYHPEIHFALGEVI